LKNCLGDKLVLFGRGVNPVSDKWEAIAPFKYHLVLENSAVPDYWSEKLADCYLGFAYPIYWGCPNILDYFSPQSLTSIDLNYPDAAIDKIQEIINSPLWQSSLPNILTARQLVLDEYNTFDVILKACLSLSPASSRRVRLKPNRFFGRLRPTRIWRSLLFRSKRAFRARAFQQ
jgi:hypothetical protein